MKIQRDIPADSALAQDLPPLEPSARAELLSAIALFQTALDGVPHELPDGSQRDLQHEARQRAWDEPQSLVLDMASPLLTPPAFGSALPGSVLPDPQHPSGTGNHGALSIAAVAAAAGQAMVPANARAAVCGESHDEMPAGSSPLSQTASALAPPITVAARPASVLMPTHADAGAAAGAASAQAWSDRAAVIPVSAGTPLPASPLTAVTAAPALPPAGGGALAPPDRPASGAQPTRAVVPEAVPPGSDIDTAVPHAASATDGATGDTQKEAVGASTGSPMPASGSVPFENFRAAQGASNSGERAASVADRSRAPQNPTGLAAAPAGASHVGQTTGIPAASTAPMALPAGAGVVEMAGAPAREMVISIPSLPGTTLYASVQNGQLAMQIVSSNASFVGQLRSLLPEIESAFNRFAGRSVQLSASSRRGQALSEGEASPLHADAVGVSAHEDPDTQTA